MAKIETVKLLDDLDGGPADESVRFALDGKSRTIDLSAANAAKLREVLAPFVAASRPDSGGAGAGKRPRSSGGSSNREQNQAIREWAAKRGMSVGDRGRLPSEVVAAYHAEQDGKPATDATPAKTEPAGKAAKPATPAKTETSKPAAKTEPAKSSKPAGDVRTGKGTASVALSGA